MKTYKELTDELMQKRNHRQSSRRKLIAAASTALCLILITVLSLKMVLPLLKNRHLPSDNVMNPVAGYEELYLSLKKLAGGGSYNGGYIVETETSSGGVGEASASSVGTKGTASASTDESKGTASASTDESKGDASYSVEYSDTNLQVIGVDEADIVKTDGRYIYVLASGNIYIAAVNKGELTLASTINESGASPVEMFITENRLVVMKNTHTEYYNKNSQPDIAGTKVAWSDWYGRYSSTQIGVDIYDITDRTAPVKVNTYIQDGSYISSRMIGSSLYLLTQKWANGINKDDISTYVPFYKLGEEKTYLDPNNIFVNTDSNGYSESYLVVCGINIEGDVSVVSGQAVFGCGSTVYCSPTSVYSVGYTSVTTDNFVSNASKILRFSIKNGEVKLTAQGTVLGSILNQFSMDEHNGYFRIVTTINSHRKYVSSGSSANDTVENARDIIVNDGDNEVTVSPDVIDMNGSNALYVLDENLSVVGKIEKLAPGERVYSVRFDGNTGYFVTFRQTDPLFTVDLTDPIKPVIKSELKIPGFSEYLHPFGQGLLFGFGKDADSNTGTSGGIKLSMFDISNPNDVTEKNKFVFKDLWYSPAENNHKSILVNGSLGLIAFAGVGEGGTVYEIFRYTAEGGFSQEAEILLNFDKNGYEIPPDYVRGMFIGEYFYTITPLGICSYTMSDFSYVSQLKF